MAELPANFKSMTRVEQLAWFVATYPDIDLYELQFMLCVERGEWRPDLGTEETRPLDDDGNPMWTDDELLDSANGSNPAEGESLRYRPDSSPISASTRTTGGLMPELPPRFAQMTRAEQATAMLAKHPWMDAVDARFFAAVERGELRPDLGEDIVEGDVPVSHRRRRRLRPARKVSNPLRRMAILHCRHQVHQSPLP
jgi:hypothetical protein